jgi:hypothetical protein
VAPPNLGNGAYWPSWAALETRADKAAQATFGPLARPNYREMSYNKPALHLQARVAPVYTRARRCEPQETGYRLGAFEGQQAATRRRTTLFERRRAQTGGSTAVMDNLHDSSSSGACLREDLRQHWGKTGGTPKVME